MNKYTTSGNLAPILIQKISLKTLSSRSFIRIFIPGKDTNTFLFRELTIYS